MENDTTKSILGWKDAILKVVAKQEYITQRQDEILTEQKESNRILTDVNTRLSVLEAVIDPEKVEERIRDLENTVSNHKMVVKIVSVVSAGLVVHALVTTFGG